MSLKKYVTCLRRIKDGEEVDFVLGENQKVVTMIETRITDSSPVKVLQKFQNLYGYTASQVVLNLPHSFQRENIQVKNTHSFLKELPI